MKWPGAMVTNPEEERKGFRQAKQTKTAPRLLSCFRSTHRLRPIRWAADAAAANERHADFIIDTTQFLSFRSPSIDFHHTLLYLSGRFLRVSPRTFKSFPQPTNTHNHFPRFVSQFVFG